MTPRSESVVHRLPSGETAESTACGGRADAELGRIARPVRARSGRGSSGSALGPTWAGRSSTQASITSPRSLRPRRPSPTAVEDQVATGEAGHGPAAGSGPASHCVVPGAGRAWARRRPARTAGRPEHARVAEGIAEQQRLGQAGNLPANGADVTNEAAERARRRGIEDGVGHASAKWSVRHGRQQRHDEEAVAEHGADGILGQVEREASATGGQRGERRPAPSRPAIVLPLPPRPDAPRTHRGAGRRRLERDRRTARERRRP